MASQMFIYLSELRLHYFCCVESPLCPSSVGLLCSGRSREGTGTGSMGGFVWVFTCTHLFVWGFFWRPSFRKGEERKVKREKITWVAVK